MADTYTTYYNLTKPAQASLDWANKVHTNLDKIDEEIHKAVTVLSAKFPVTFKIPGDLDPNTKMHFHLQVDDAPDFSDIIVEVESKDDQTDWKYSNGTAWIAVPTDGVDAYWQAEQDDWNQWRVVPKAYAGYNCMYLVGADAGVERNTLYYFRFRQWDGTDYGAWSLGSFLA